MNMNRERRETSARNHFPGSGKMARDQFPDVTKLITSFNPSEFDGFGLAEGVEIDSFGTEHKNAIADSNYGEKATITRMIQP